ncbi:MAG TPA: hypothetical protein VMF89_08355 [Polyangiales bacterium]|nr:hypothetical protein [Polyangiales bacterium]
MFRKSIQLSVVGALLAAAGCATASQQVASHQVTGTRCESISDLDQRVHQLLAASNIERVTPAYHQVPHFDGPKPLYIEGAEIYIPAEAGINEAYLERALSCYAAAQNGTAQAQHPLRAAGIRSISARESGQTFRVSIRGVDRKAGAEIWKRAQALHNASGTIEIRQLSGAPSQTSSM